MDVAIFGDISKSMRKQQRKKLVNFIEELLDSTLVSADGNHVALGTLQKLLIFITSLTIKNSTMQAN